MSIEGKKVVPGQDPIIEDRRTRTETSTRTVPPAKPADEKDISKAVAAIAGGEDYVQRMVSEALEKADRQAPQPDRRLLRFPEVEKTELEAAGLNERSMTTFSRSRISPIKQAFAEWFGCISRAPNGFAHQLARTDLVKRALSGGTDEAGGYLLPEAFHGELFVSDDPKEITLYNRVRHIGVTERSGKIPILAQPISGGWQGENVDFDETDLEFDQDSYAIKRVGAFTTLTRELTADAEPNLVNLVVEEFKKWMAQERDRVIVIGNGTTQPMGIYSASGVTDVVVTSLTYDNIVELKESLDQIHQKKSVWVINQRHKKAIMKIKDSDGRPIFQSDVHTDFQPMILGLPVIIEESVPNNFAFCGDLSRYFWFDRELYTIEATTQGDTAFKKHQTWVKFFERVDGKPVLPRQRVSMVRTRVLAGIS